MIFANSFGHLLPIDTLKQPIKQLEVTNYAAQANTGKSMRQIDTI